MSSHDQCCVKIYWLGPGHTNATLIVSHARVWCITQPLTISNCFTMESSICGHYMYTTVWTPVINR